MSLGTHRPFLGRECPGLKICRLTPFPYDCSILSILEHVFRFKRRTIHQFHARRSIRSVFPFQRLRRKNDGKCTGRPFGGFFLEGPGTRIDEAEYVERKSIGASGPGGRGPVRDRGLCRLQGLRRR
ncbi:hypothetical protein Sfum_1188 [Syntrophobacter fumaroxidans MPOB]|uniref:Uncharacterized protein n=1 Tax=Syntrophobacter fumaroxidans (strain DSM 10017 / MPOB) TaxID=335543 RepID=A0LHH9_SYNFM|nr:hypothetical protein Sfum_1188 [Syntrophobacter fumaroxidans MPOB]